MRRRDILLTLFGATAIVAMLLNVPAVDPPAPARHSVAGELHQQVGGLQFPNGIHSAIEARRNLFAYVEPPRPRAMASAFVPPPVQPPAVVEATPPPPAPQPAEPALPAFGYRCIGRLGPDSAPLAAFANDGGVVVARAGERIGDAFVLREIGMESVVIGIVGSEKTLTVGIGR